MDSQKKPLSVNWAHDKMIRDDTLYASRVEIIEKSIGVGFQKITYAKLPT